MLVRLAYLAVGKMFAALRLIPVGEREKDIELLVLPYQITVLQRQLGPTRARFTPEDRVLLAALLSSLPRGALGRLRLLVRPDAVLKWHRDLSRRRHAAHSKRIGPGRPRTVAFFTNNNDVSTTTGINETHPNPAVHGATEVMTAHAVRHDTGEVIDGKVTLGPAPAQCALNSP